MSADDIDMAALLNELSTARDSGNMETMQDALDDIYWILKVAELTARREGTRKERAERVFDFLGFDELAAEGKQVTGEMICHYIHYRMQKDKRDKPTQAYYDEVAHEIQVHPRVVQRYWSDNYYCLDRHAEFEGDTKNLRKGLLGSIKRAYKNEGQRLTKKPR